MRILPPYIPPSFSSLKTPALCRLVSSCVRGLETPSTLLAGTRCAPGPGTPEEARSGRPQRWLTKPASLTFAALGDQRCSGHGAPETRAASTAASQARSPRAAVVPSQAWPQEQHHHHLPPSPAWRR
ncbi:hypothetical protein KIL84_004365 [Mauremys mutica]|uniref:Uncharacterized protein n=1 Tax=Mauremys mutica TaxID=74926 RepID=A0A9D3XP82_9SAUR|nr:hypothetical protein KIL84_004365 [Mauremys mutica]